MRYMVRYIGRTRDKIILNVVNLNVVNLSIILNNVK